MRVCFCSSVSKPAFVRLFGMYVCVFYVRVHSLTCICMCLCLCVLVCVRLSFNAYKQISAENHEKQVQTYDLELNVNNVFSSHLQMTFCLLLNLSMAFFILHKVSSPSKNHIGKYILKPITLHHLFEQKNCFCRST